MLARCGRRCPVGQATGAPAENVGVKDFRNKVAAITGAASGIGRALALDLAGRGAHVALADLDDAGLAETAEQVRRTGVTCTSTNLDVADRAAMFAWADQVVADHGRANLIFNNAGVALGATVAQMSIDDFEWLMGINLGGVVHGTQAFLPHLQASGEGHIVNISSVFGLLGIPTQSAYNAAKFGVRGFTEALRIELDVAGNGVSATCVHPGGIKTNIARNARMNVDDTEADAMEEGRRSMERAFITSPAKAAKVILRAVERNKRRVIVGPDAYAFLGLSTLPPGVYQRLVGAGAKRRL
jgi:NAD(P)-dependent dehydrogenase (short-subunit alcohol dehydrogenase family)